MPLRFRLQGLSRLRGKGMDCRIKSGNDGEGRLPIGTLTYKHNPIETRPHPEEGRRPLSKDARAVDPSWLMIPVNC